MKKLLFIFISLSFLLTSCEVEVGKNNIPAYSRDPSINLATLIDSIFTDSQLKLSLCMMNNGVVNVAGQSFGSINTVQLISVEQKLDALLERQSQVTTPGEKITSSAIKKWMKQNPGGTKELMSQLLRESPEIFE